MPKKTVTIYLEPELKAEAKALGLNLSQSAEHGIRRAIEDLRIAKAATDSSRDP